MFLKRLDVQGFKTFATRTIFDFGPGICAIVGPNGSGKSNIADAVRWALGEQNPRAVRCRHGDDVIFAGSGKRPPVGMAEVSLTFDNTSGWLPIDYAEVAITRRAYRSGENEYLINGARVRLRDVADLLRRAALEAGGHVVVGQGVVDAVLSQRAEERKALVESLAGLRHYYVRRDEAEGRLRATETNLDSIGAVIAENEPLLAALAAQAEVARAYAVAVAELHSALRLAYAHQQRALLRRRAEAVAQATATAAELAANRAAIQDGRVRLAALLHDEQSAAVELAGIEAEAGRAEAAREESERDLAVLRARAEDQRRRAAEVGGDLQRLAARLAHSRAEAQRTAAVRADASAGQAVQEDVARALSGADVELDALLRTTGAALRQAEDEAAARRRADDAAKRALGGASAAALRAHDEARVLRGALDRAEASLETATRALAAAQPQLGVLRAAADEAARGVARREQALAAARTAEEQAARGCQEAQTALAAAEGRVVLLRRWLADVAGTHPLLSSSPIGDMADAAGVLGSVAGSLRIPARWHTAVAAASGPALQAALLRGEESLPRLAAEARAGGTPRMAVVALDGHRPRLSAGERADLLGRCLAATGSATCGAEDAVVGWAVDLVTDAHEGRLVAELLDATLLVRDVATMLACRAVVPSGVHFVTPAGEVLLPNGVLLCGRDQGQDQLMESHDELRRLPAEVETLRARHGAAREEHARDQAAASAAAGEDAAARQAASVAATDATAAAGEVSLQERLRGAARQERARAARDLEACEARAERLAAGLADLEVRSQAARSRCAAAEVALADARRAHAARLAERDAATARRQAVSAALALARQEAATTHAAHDRAAAALTDAERDLAAKEGEGARHGAESAALAEQERRARERHARVLAHLSSCAEALPPVRDRIARVRAARALLESALARQEGEMRGLTATAQAAEEGAARAARERNALAETVETELGVALADLPAPEGAPPSAARLRAMRGRLAEFGAVNQRAVEDFEATQARLAFLRDQAADLVQGIALLRAVIEEANATVREQFAATLAALEASFVSYFRQLFGGGNAGLRATYDAEGMPAGVEVSAQPPGKRTQDLALLSGGERAMVALALLFAMLAVRPVPFCLLDEVEAALDESNTGRCVEILRSLSQSTQFVVITHNRGTMVQADTLYGVTMSDAGTSQVASLALRSAAAQADDPIFGPDARAAVGAPS